jgi:pseudouridine synthase
MPKTTLYQALKRSGLFSSKQELAKAVSKGLVELDGKVTRTLQFQFDPSKKKVIYDGKEVTEVSKKYYVINKPVAYSCQRNDKYPNIVNLIDVKDRIKNSLFPIGRLDIPTTGLLIITNDGELSKKLTDPKNKVEKNYWVLTKKQITEDQINKLQQGVTIKVENKNYKTLPAKAKFLKPHELELTITEGKYRQVRKMLEAVNNRVMALRRDSISNLKLKNYNISEGQWKEIEEKEIKKFI